MDKNKASWYGENGIMTKLEAELQSKGIFWNEDEPLFQEFVARGHIDGGMSINELHRNYDISLSTIRRWVKAYQTKNNFNTKS